MFHALAVEKDQSAASWRTTASRFEEMLAHREDLRTSVALYDLENMSPVHFRKAHKRLGYSKDVSACFAYAAGYAPHEDHIFSRNQNPAKLMNAVHEGKKVLISLNADMTNRDVDFGKLRHPLAQRVEKWMAANAGNYFIQSVRSADDLLKLLRKIKKEEPGYGVKANVSVLHRGAVLPYPQFFMRAQGQNFQDLFANMAQGVEGIFSDKTHTRIIGFPHLIEFNIASQTVQEKGARGLRSQPHGYWSGMNIISQLVVRDHNSKDPMSLTDQWEKVREMGASFYVLAAPVITPPKLGDKWGHIRWVINDMDKQFGKKGDGSGEFKLEPPAGRYPAPEAAR